MTAVRPAGGAVLCLVTPGPAGPSVNTPRQREEALDALVRDAVAERVDLVQIREPDLPARQLAEIVARAVQASRGTATRILVNDRVDVALAAGADGVHLGTRSLPARRVREITPPSFLVGRSIHSGEEARDLAADPAIDYLIAGTVFPSRSKPEQSHFLGPDGLAAIVRRTGAAPERDQGHDRRQTHAENDAQPGEIGVAAQCTAVEREKRGRR